jgi:hypothetical protein
VNVKFLIKFTKAEWAEDIKYRGRIFFNPAYKFCSSPHYSSGQYDPFDSHINHNAEYFVYAPIIEENEDGIKYGPARKIADKARIHLQDSRNKNVPISCFRMVYNNEIKDNILRFDDQLYEKIRNDFEDYDSFALICFPHVFFDIISKSHWGNKVYGHWTYYGDSSEFDDFYTGNNEEGFTKNTHLYKCLAKRENTNINKNFE